MNRMGWLLAVYTGLACTQLSYAILVRPDRAESTYRDMGSDYRAVVDILPAGSGTLIAPDWVLTAAHSVDEYALEGTLLVVALEEQTCQVAEIVLHPDYATGYAHHDVALLRLETPLRGIAPLPIYVGADEEERDCVVAGYGWSGPMDLITPLEISGESPRFVPGIKRAGTNRINRVTDATIHTRFERGEDQTKLECSIAGGDSGGPLLLDFSGKDYVAGIISGYTLDDPVEVDYTRASVYSRWIEDVTGHDFGAPRRARIWGWLAISIFGVIGVLFAMKYWTRRDRRLPLACRKAFGTDS